MTKRLFITMSLLISAVGIQSSQAHSPPNDAKVLIIEPADGAVVTSPLLVKPGIEGFGITPPRTKGKRRHTAGHHHVLADLEQLPNMDEPIPRDANHVHLDGGETEVLLELSPGVLGATVNLSTESATVEFRTDRLWHDLGLFRACA